MHSPTDIQIIGNEIAVRWSDGVESYFHHEHLRAASPSAENQGERDIFGKLHGGDSRTKFPGVLVTNWERVGNYAIRFDFTDGHRTGLYTYEYLRKLHDSVLKNSS